MKHEIKEVIRIDTIDTKSITDKFDCVEYRNGDSMIVVTHRYDGISEKHLTTALHAHSYYELEFIYDGSGAQILSSSSFNMTRGNAYLRTPNNLHTTWQDVHNVLKSYNIRFSTDYISKEIETYLMAADNALCVKFDENEIQSMVIQIERLIDEIQNRRSYMSLMINSLFNEILVAFMRKYHFMASQNSGHSRHIQYVLDYINVNFCHTFTVNELAKTVHLNSHYLGDLFVRETGKSISEYVLDLRLILAVQLIMNSSMTVNEISSQCGFNSLSYFILKFRKRYGLSPMKYKKNKAADNNQI